MTSLRPRILQGSLCTIFPAVLVLTHPTVSWAYSTGPFGTGLPDGSVPGTTYFPRLARMFISAQVYFDQHMTRAVHAIRHDGSALWSLLALSFLYGVLHAIGPGHGKAVVSSYVIATRQTLRNGVVLAAVASLAQACGAILLVLIASMVLHLTSVSMTTATLRFELISDLLVVLLGCWLVWNKIIRPMRGLRFGFVPTNSLILPSRVLSAAPQGTAQLRFQATEIPAAMVRLPQVASAIRGVNFNEVSSDGDDRSFHHNHAPGHACDCGHLHMPDAAAAAGTLDWRKAWTVVASTALRPCTGALIVLVFAISQKLLMAGIAATLVMGLGTGITVTSLAVLAVSARKTAFVLTGMDSAFGRRIIRGLEICGALAVLSVGILLLAGTLLM
jgi:nickel/cobalt transporter (NicO) family protein